jgi:dephospho-CoA kinase
VIGGIGSGKSLVAAEFARRGALLISGDQLGHEALQRDDVKAKIVDRWGKEVLTGTGDIDRGKLGGIVFADLKELRALESLVFPWIEHRIREEVGRGRTDLAAAAIVLDAAVMVEAGWDRECDWIVYVHAPRRLRLARLAAKRGWGEKELQARERAQLPLTEKLDRAHYVVNNSGPPEEVVRQVEWLWQQWKLALPAKVPSGTESVRPNL